jgi:uncharacterized protein (DUF433 family)
MTNPKHATAPEERITVDPAILAGKPTIRGLRISVEQILRALGVGVSIDAILDDYPVLSREDIQACCLYAAELVEHEQVFAVAGNENSH